MTRPCVRPVRPGALLAAAALLLTATPALLGQAAPARPADPGPPPRKVAVLVFDGVQTIDYAAPIEVLAGWIATLRVERVAP